MFKRTKKITELVHNKEHNDIRDMFDSVAPSYDFLNCLLSLGIDKYWRFNVSLAIKKHDKKNKVFSILDIATGTGDLAINLSKKIPDAKITGVDISKNMLQIAETKINSESNIIFKEGSAESLSFNNNSFEAVTVAFGVRNFENLKKGLSEIYRTLKVHGIAVFLEPTVPETKIVRTLYLLYLSKVIPFIGKHLSPSLFAYNYFSMSVVNFPQGESFLKILEDVGFERVKMIQLTFQTAMIYLAYKR